jgi:polar amino acid transport system permease protein
VEARRKRGGPTDRAQRPLTDKFAHYLTTGWLLDGIVFTLQLTVYGFAGGLVLGLVLALAQLTRFKPLAVVAQAYVVVYRGTPLILQMVFVFTALPHVGISFPPLMAASVALAMNEAAFFAEIFRSGVRGVDPGQLAAARALGLVPTVVAQRIVVPQVARTSVPALGNEAIATMKNSALASITAVPELTLRTQQLTSATFDYFSVYFATGAMYLALTGALDRGAAAHRGRARPRPSAPALNAVPTAATAAQAIA